jgi:hypothetical protein
MSSFGIFKDSNLILRADSIHFDIAPGGSSDLQLWFGSPIDNRLASPSGGGFISVGVNDSVGGSGLPATAIKLALTQGGLTGATPGASLNLATEVNSGIANEVPFWVRLTDSVGAGLYLDLSLTMNFFETGVML